MTTAAPTVRRQDLYAVGLLSLMALFLYADQNLMAPNLTQMAEEFGFTPEQKDVKLGGDIALVFWMLGAVVTLLVGYLTDRWSRKWLLGVVIFIGEIPCFLTGYAESYDQLYWLRALTGLGIGGAIPLLYSLIGDYFPPRVRPLAVAGIGLAMGLGIAFGQLLAGMLGPTHGWRLPFMVVAAPNFGLALLFLATIREPTRGRAERGIGAAIERGELPAARIDRAAYAHLFRIPSNLLVFVQGAVGTVPWGVFFVFLNDYFHYEKGYTVEDATLIVLTVGAAAIIGGFVGGAIGNRLYNRSPRNLPLLCGASTLLGVIPTAALIHYPSQIGVVEPALWPPLLIGLASGFTIAMTAPNVRTVLINVNTPETRGSIFALYNLADDLGRGFGPFFISLLIVAMGRQWAFHTANLFWVACGLLLLLMARTFPRDERAMEARLDARRERAADGEGAR
ncbi:MFS transporter [Haliangium sp.]|uniref:MFS transporter n=1 Tax=Haliangium sp. TaxID=2663208 RepID=UPI003D0D742E